MVDFRVDKVNHTRCVPVRWGQGGRVSCESQQGPQTHPCVSMYVDGGHLSRWLLWVPINDGEQIVMLQIGSGIRSRMLCHLSD